MKIRQEDVVPAEHNILEKANDLTLGARRKGYGHPYDNFNHTAQLWSVILGKHVTAEQFALCMIAVKISRECHKHDSDNLVDIAGYARTIEMIYEHPEVRDALRSIEEYNIHG